jgi:hypothetical protein
MIRVFVQNRRPLATSQVNLQGVMSFTGVWKQNAQLETVVEVAVYFLQLYKDVDPAAANLKVKLLMEFEVERSHRSVPRHPSLALQEFFRWGPSF